ncbi:MAG: EutN/CcmL family microcompartment protein [Deltaproteobacteria bacterium]
MYLGQVIGTVVATRRIPGLEGRRLLYVQPVDHEARPAGSPEVAVDVTQAGPGELVFLVGSREAALACEPSFVPVDSAIVGIVDELPGASPQRNRSANGRGEGR